MWTGSLEVNLRGQVSRSQGLKVSRFQRLQSFKVSKFQVSSFEFRVVIPSERGRAHARERESRDPAFSPPPVQPRSDSLPFSNPIPRLEPLLSVAERSWALL